MTYRPVRCRVCGRLRLEDGAWIVTDVTVAGEVPDGICSGCRIGAEATRELGRRLTKQRVRRERRTGKKYGPAPHGVDVWKGLR